MLNNKKIVLRRQYKNHTGDVIEVTEEITSNCPKFHKIFDNLTEIARKMDLPDLFNTMIDPSDN